MQKRSRRIDLRVTEEDHASAKALADEARTLMANPDTPEAQAVIALAEDRFEERLRDVAVN